MDSGALPSQTHPGSPSPGSQADLLTGGAGTAMGPPWSGWSMRQRQLAVRLRDCWCPVCPCRAVTVSGEAWLLLWGQDGTSDSSHPHSPTPALLQIVACGCWQLPGLGGCVKNQPPCSRSAETPSSGVTHHPCHHPGRPTSVREGLCRAVGDGEFGGIVGWPKSQIFEGRGGEVEALTCSGFQGISGSALVGGAGEKPLQVSGSPRFFS